MDNDFHDEGVPNADTDVARGMLLWDATDSTEVLLKVETSKLDEHGGNWQVFADYSEGTFPYLLENDPDYVPPTQPLTLGATIYNLAREDGENFPTTIRRSQRPRTTQAGRRHYHAAGNTGTGRNMNSPTCLATAATTATSSTIRTSRRPASPAPNRMRISTSTPMNCG